MNDDVATASLIAVVEFRDDGRYETMCPKGHKSITILQSQKFEVLFDIGAYAIVDGYYREAISSFTSSLERFYEFAIRAVLLDKGIDEKAFKQTWNLVAKQSERQIGAFVFLYLTELGKPAAMLRNDLVEFRNKVIHQGKIPTRQEAVDYGQAVLDAVRPILKEVKEKYPNGVQKAVFQHLKSCRGRTDDNYPVSTLGVRTVLSLMAVSDRRPMEELLTDLRTRVFDFDTKEM